MSEKLYGILLQEAIPSPDKPQKIKNLVVNKEAKELLEKQSKEIERLNNIINELERHLEQQWLEWKDDSSDEIAAMANEDKCILDKLQELKGDSSNE